MPTPAHTAPRSPEGAQHTAGPWKVAGWLPDTAVDCAKFITTDESQPMALAAVYFDIDKGEANAALIAATPALLDALNRISWGEFANNVSYAEQVRAMRDIARAAIALTRPKTS